MTNLFKILPAVEIATELHLLAEVDNAGIVFIFYSKAPFVIHGLLGYQFEKDADEQDNIESIEILLGHEDFLQRNFLSVNLCLDVKESLLIPTKYFEAENAATMISLQYGQQKHQAILHDEVNHIDAVLVYNTIEALQKTWLQKFPMSGINHSSALLLKHFSFIDNTLLCIISPTKIKVFIYKNEGLQLVQQFDYKLPADVVYHLLNACKQFNINPDDITVLLSGLIEENSALYKDIYKYFLNVQFDDSGKADCSEVFNEYPAHYFSNLIQLAR